MNWYYVDQGNQAGPVDDARFEELRRSGAIQPETLVWREGMPEWKPAREAAPQLTSAPPAEGAPPVQENPGVTATTTGQGGVICAECNGVFGVNDVIRYQDKWVCAKCKPVFFQRLREGGGPGAAPKGKVVEAEVVARDYEVDIGTSVSTGWEVFKANAGLVIAANVLVYAAMAVANFIPYIGFILAIIFTGPLMGGIWMFYLKAVRAEPLNISDAFAGFGPRFKHLFFCYAFQVLAIMALVFGVAVIMALVIPGVFRGNEPSTAFKVTFGILMGFGLVVIVAAIIYLTTCWFFSIPLVIDKNYRALAALTLSGRIVRKHFWMTLLLMIVWWALSFVGILFCFVGVLVTGSVGFAALVHHYNKVFGDLAPSPD